MESDWELAASDWEGNISQREARVLSASARRQSLRSARGLHSSSFAVLCRGCVGQAFNANGDRVQYEEVLGEIFDDEDDTERRDYFISMSGSSSAPCKPEVVLLTRAFQLSS